MQFLLQLFQVKSSCYCTAQRQYPIKQNSFAFIDTSPAENTQILGQPGFCQGIIVA